MRIMEKNKEHRELISKIANCIDGSRGIRLSGTRAEKKAAMKKRFKDIDDQFNDFKKASGCCDH